MQRYGAFADRPARLSRAPYGDATIDPKDDHCQRRSHANVLLEASDWRLVHADDHICCIDLGTEGTLELRKYIDVARSAPASTLFLVDRDGEREIDCAGNTGFPFFGRLIQDCLHRTENAMTQAHAFKAAELSMRAQLIADSL